MNRILTFCLTIAMAFCAGRAFAMSPKKAGAKRKPDFTKPQNMPGCAYTLKLLGLFGLKIPGNVPSMTYDQFGATFGKGKKTSRKPAGLAALNKNNPVVIIVNHLGVPTAIAIDPSALKGPRTALEQALKKLDGELPPRSILRFVKQLKDWIQSEGEDKSMMEHRNKLKPADLLLGEEKSGLAVEVAGMNNRLTPQVVRNGQEVRAILFPTNPDPGDPDLAIHLRDDGAYQLTATTFLMTSPRALFPDGLFALDPKGVSTALITKGHTGEPYLVAISPELAKDSKNHSQILNQYAALAGIKEWQIPEAVTQFLTAYAKNQNAKKLKHLDPKDVQGPSTTLTAATKKGAPVIVDSEGGHALILMPIPARKTVEAPPPKEPKASRPPKDSGPKKPREPKGEKSPAKPAAPQIALRSIGESGRGPWVYVLPVSNFRIQFTSRGDATDRNPGGAPAYKLDARRPAAIIRMSDGEISQPDVILYPLNLLRPLSTNARKRLHEKVTGISTAEHPEWISEFLSALENLNPEIDVQLSELKLNYSVRGINSSQLTGTEAPEILASLSRENQIGIVQNYDEGTYVLIPAIRDNTPKGVAPKPSTSVQSLRDLLRDDGPASKPATTSPKLNAADITIADTSTTSTGQPARPGASTVLVQVVTEAKSPTKPPPPEIPYNTDADNLAISIMEYLLNANPAALAMNATFRPSEVFQTNLATLTNLAKELSPNQLTQIRDLFLADTDFMNALHQTDQKCPRPFRPSLRAFTDAYNLTSELHLAPVMPSTRP